MTLVSADYKFLIVDIGAQGRHSDGGILKNSEIGHRFNEKLMDLPPPSIIDPYTQPLPFVIVADEAFQLNSYTMRPYPGRNMTLEKRIFNYRLSKARRVVENVFGITMEKLSEVYEHIAGYDRSNCTSYHLPSQFYDKER